MYLITSNTNSDIAIDVVQNGESKVIHLDKKFSTSTTDELNEKILFLGNKGIILYSEVINDTSNEEVKEQQSRRGRKPNNQKTDSHESTTDEKDSSDDRKE